MKKSYLTLAAMAMIMASCSNEVLVDDSEKSGATDVAIGFSTFSDKATKAQTKPAGSDYFLEDYHESFKVFGTKTDAENNVQYVFNGVVTDYVETESKRDATGEWHYAPARYWDKQAKNYKFLAFAPAHAPLKYTRADDSEIDATGNKFESTSTLTLSGTNLMQEFPASDVKNTGFVGEKVNYTQEEADEINARNLVEDKNGKKPGEADYIKTFKEGFTEISTSTVKHALADCDVMITGSVMPITAISAKMAPVDLIFKHTLSKLTVSMTKKERNTPNVIVKVSSVEVKNYLAQGTFDTDSWTAKADGSTVDYVYNSPIDQILSETVPTYFVESLVMPQDIKSAQVITVKYSVTSVDPDDADNTYTEDFIYTQTMDKIFDTKATKYAGNSVYNVKFVIDPEANVITFDAGVSKWATNIDGNATID